MLEDEARRSIVAQAAAGLDAVHTAADERGPLFIVHRDVSPENLFVCEDQRVKVFDFNIALFRDHAEPAVRGALQGRVAYMAPEQARGEPVASSADVFSLGVVAWELFAGARLFWRGNTPATLRALCDHDEPIPRLASRRALPPELHQLDELVARMLDRTPSARPTAVQVAHALVVR